MRELEHARNYNAMSLSWPSQLVFLDLRHVILYLKTFLIFSENFHMSLMSCLGTFHLILQ